MKKFLKMSVCLSALAALSILGSACGSKKTTTTTKNPTIVVFEGNRGYYTGTTFCYWGNNYCNSGLAYGIM